MKIFEEVMKLDKKPKEKVTSALLKMNRINVISEEDY